MIRGLVFDIDDTLYLEREYVRSGFAHVAHVAGDSDDEARILSQWLWEAFESGVRGDTFGRLLEAFPELAMRVTVRDLVEAYRAHQPDIELLPGMAEALDVLYGRGLRLGVLSDGPASSQAAKATTLGLDHWFDPIILTGALGIAYAKPATAGFELIASGWSIDGPGMAYVADNPAKDFAGPRRLGWLTIRLRQPDQLRPSLEAAAAAFSADLEVGAPAELLDRIKSWDAPAGG